MVDLNHKIPPAHLLEEAEKYGFVPKEGTTWRQLSAYLHSLQLQVVLKEEDTFEIILI